MASTKNQDKFNQQMNAITGTKTYTASSGWTPSSATGDTDSDNNWKATTKTTEQKKADTTAQNKNIQAPGYSPTSAAYGESSSAAYEQGNKIYDTTQWKPTDATGSTETDNDFSSALNTYIGYDGTGVNPGYDSPSATSGSSGKTAGASASSSSSTQTANTSALDQLKAEYEAKLAELTTKNSKYDELVQGLYDKLDTQDATYTDLINGLNNKLTTQDATYTNLINELNGKLTTSEDSLNKIQAAYDTALAEQKKAIQAGVDQSVNSLNNQKGNVNTSYADTMRQLYLDKMTAQKNIGQQMAAAGQTGGQAESTLLGLNTNYADALRQSEQAKTSALSELETAIANAQLSGSAEEAQAIANNATNSVNAYTNQLNALTGNQINLASLINNANNADFSNGISLASLVNNNNQQNFSNGLSLADYINGANNQSYTNAYNRAMAFLQYGVMPDAETLANAGIDTATAQSLINSVNAQASAKASSGSGTDDSNGSGLNKTQYATKVNAIVNGKAVTQADIDAIEAYSGSTFEEVMREAGIDPASIKYSSGSNPYAEEEETEMYNQVGTNNGDKLSVSTEAEMIYNESGKEQVLAYLKDMYDNKGLSVNTYRTLLNKYNKK